MKLDGIFWAIPPWCKALKEKRSAQAQSSQAFSSPSREAIRALCKQAYTNFETITGLIPGMHAPALIN